jgi:hypothetical protein
MTQKPSEAAIVDSVSQIDHYLSGHAATATASLGARTLRTLGRQALNALRPVVARTVDERADRKSGHLLGRGRAKGRKRIRMAA